MGNDLFEYGLNFNRRRFLSKASLGLGSLALGSLLVPGLFGGNKKNTETFSAPSAGKAADATKLKEMKSNLAKIGNTQKRDYEAEAKARAPPPKVLQDKQTLSFNFNKPNEFPNLFKGR